jgi:hypothetical protein
VGRLWETLTRTPPVVAPEELRGRTDLVFGFATRQDPEGWLVQAYGADGRRIGRPIMGVSSGALATMTAPVEQTTDPAELRRLADAWATACKRSSHNAELMRLFSASASADADRQSN